MKLNKKGGLYAMKKCVLNSILLMLLAFALFINPSEKIAQYSFYDMDEPVISSVDTIASSDVIIESVQTVIPKWQTESLFASTNIADIIKGKLLPFKFINHLFFSKEIAGFICVVQYQSNYLP